MKSSIPFSCNWWAAMSRGISTIVGGMRWNIDLKKSD